MFGVWDLVSRSWGSGRRGAIAFRFITIPSRLIHTKQLYVVSLHIALAVKQWSSAVSILIGCAKEMIFAELECIGAVIVSNTVRIAYQEMILSGLLGF
jgi:hypothetical protein